MLDEKLLVFVLGAPGAGKGTQCDLVVKEYGWIHISAGDLLRAQVSAGTPVGKDAEEYLKQGTMVPASMIIGLLREALSDAKHTKVLIDGFPRVLDQLKEFERQVRPCDKALFYNVPEEAARDRLLKRGLTSGRVDDNEETIKKRFVVFKEESMPVITELETEGRVAEFDAAQPPEQVFAATRLVIEQLQQQQADKAQQAVKAAAVATAAPEPAAVPAVTTAVSPAEKAVPSPASPVAAAPAAGTATVVQSPEAPHPAGAPVPRVAASADGAAVPAPSPRPQVAAGPLSPAGHVTAPHPVSSPLAVVLPVVPTTSVSAATIAAALPAAAAAMAAASSPQKPAAGTPAAAAVAPAAPPQPEAAAAAAGAAAAVSSPTAATATIAGLQVDLSGIRTPVVICGPSGVGKGTLISKLMAQYADRFGFSASHTTRDPRPGEVHGKHYYFTDKESMAAQVAAGMFLEHAVVHGNMYGTSLAAVAHVSAAGKHCVLDIDVQGAGQVRKSALGPHCLFIFVAPPSHEELERRLRNRGTETEEKVLQRLANAQSEIAKAQEPGLFHHVLVNAELEAAYQELLKLINQRLPGLLTSTQDSPQQQQQQQAGTGSQRSSEAGGAAAVLAAGPQSAPTSAPVTPAAAALQAGAAAAGAGTLAAAAAAAAGAAALPQQQQVHAGLANGNVNVSTAAAGAGTATLLDFGFGANAGPAVASKGMPVRQYMDAMVIPVLREGLKALNIARPDDPLQFLADYLVAHKAAAA